MPLTKASYSMITGSPVNVRDFGAVGNGVNDDTAAFQAAIIFCEDNLRPLYIPENDVSQFYKITAPLVVSKPLVMRGAGSYDVTLFSVGFTSNDVLLDIDGTAFGNYQQAYFGGFTLRHSGAGICMRVTEVSKSRFEDIGLYGGNSGIQYTGSTRCFSNEFTKINTLALQSAIAFQFVSHTGGGQHTFVDCSFGGNTGFSVDQNTITDSINFYSCNFESCVTQSVYVAGTVAGLGFFGCRTENCGSYDFNIDPVLGKTVSGLVVEGTYFDSSGAGGQPRILLGGTGGKVRGFNVNANSVGHGANNFSSFLVELNGDGESGTIANNYLDGTLSLCKPVNLLRAGVAVYNNEANNGKFAPSFVVNQNTFTATATGMTTSPTGTVKYSVIGNTVTLDIPAISGTSNTTAFTLTGAPAAIAPAADKDILIRITDNGTIALGFVRVKTTGVLEFYATVSGGAFTNSGTKAVNVSSVTYTLA
jgi:hypothetical protein